MFLSYLCKDHITFSMQLIEKHSWEDSYQLHLAGERALVHSNCPLAFQNTLSSGDVHHHNGHSQEAVGLKIAVLTLTWSRSYSSIKSQAELYGQQNLSNTALKGIKNYWLTTSSKSTAQFNICQKFCS